MANAAGSIFALAIPKRSLLDVIKNPFIPVNIPMHTATATNTTPIFPIAISSTAPVCHLTGAPDASVSASTSCHGITQSVTNAIRPYITAPIINADIISNLHFCGGKSYSSADCGIQSNPT